MSTTCARPDSVADCARIAMHAHEVHQPLACFSKRAMPRRGTSASSQLCQLRRALGRDLLRTKPQYSTGLGSQSLAHTSMLPPSKWLLMVTLPAASVSCDLDPVDTTEPSAHLRCEMRDHTMGRVARMKGGARDP